MHRQRQKDEPSLPFFRNRTTLPFFHFSIVPILTLSSPFPLTRFLLTPRLLPSTPTASGTNNGVKFIRLHIGTIKRQADRQPSERAGRQRGSTKAGLILNIIYLCQRKSEGGVERAHRGKPRTTTDKLCLHRGSIQRRLCGRFSFRMRKDTGGSSNLHDS